MALIQPAPLRDVLGITDEQRHLMRAYLQGSVYCWCKNRTKEEFALRDLVGGENFEWRGTPLYPLYEKHIGSGKSNEDAITAAARDAGWLLRSVLSEDKRHFNVAPTFSATAYRWVGNEA